MDENIDIRTVDPGSLRHLEDVHIDTSLPCEQRIRSYLEQIGNPHCYLDGNTVVSLGFSDTGSALKDQLKSLADHLD